MVGKIGISLLGVLGILMQFTIAQNYADSALALYERIDPEVLTETELMVLDTTKWYFQPDNDTLTLYGLNYLSVLISEPQLKSQFRGYFGAHCELCLKKDLSPTLKRIFRRFYSSYFQNEALSLWDSNEREKALEAQYKMMAIREELADTPLIINGLISLAYQQGVMGDYEKADKTNQRALDFQRSFADNSHLADIYMNIAWLHTQQKEYQLSIPYFEQALPVARRQGNGQLEVHILEGLGWAYANAGNYSKGISYVEEGLALASKLEVRHSIATLHLALARLNRMNNKLPEAEKYGLEALERSKKLNWTSFKGDVFEELAKIYEKKEDYKKGNFYLKQFYTLKDSLDVEKSNKAALEQEYSFKYRQKVAVDSMRNASAMAIQIAENRKRRNTSYFLLGIVLLIGIFAFILFNRFRIIRDQKVIIEEEKLKLDQANEQLKSLDESKSRFFTNISHEFRTPLTVIAGMADMVSDSEPRELIKRNSQSLLWLVNQILDLRKLESGKLPVHLQQGDVIPFLKYLLESFQSYAESKGVELTFSTKEEELVMDYDREKLYSIITNLLSNAIKFTPDGGRVSLEVSGFEFLVSGDQATRNSKPETRNFLSISVSDTGIGIPEEKLPHIFDRFYQVDDSSTRQGEGTGIGLTLTRDLVKVLGGEIKVSSEVAKGTQFQLQLPIRNQAPWADEDLGNLRQQPLPVLPDEIEALPAGASAAYKLLIVEDNPDVVRYLQTCLKDAYQISIAKDGQEGIEKAIEEVPDIIISDVMMPRKDGFELCQSLKTDERTSHIPIILLTAKADVESRISGLQRGADAYLAKPFDKAELMVRLEMLIKLRQQLQARYQQLGPVEPTEDAAIQQEDEFINKLREAIFENLDDTSLNMTKLCKLMGVSRTQLHRKVTALTGLSSSRFLRRVRTEEALKLLQQTELNISEIAYQVGFDDPAYFSRLFSKDFGKSPSEMRK